MVVGSVEEAFSVGVLEVGQHRGDQVHCNIHPGLVKGGFVECHQGVGKTRIVVQVRVKPRLAPPPAVQKSSVVASQIPVDEFGSRGGCLYVPRFVQDAPARAAASIISPFQLTSTLSSFPGRTRRSRTSQQAGARVGQIRCSTAARSHPLRLGDLSNRLGQIEDVLALEVAAAVTS